MKIRVTLMTENDKHLDLPKEKIETIARGAWIIFLAALQKDKDDRYKVESIELVEP